MSESNQQPVGDQGDDPVQQDDIEPTHSQDQRMENEEEQEPTEEQKHQEKMREIQSWKTKSIEDKKAVLMKYQYTNWFFPGAYVDAQDTTQAWMVAQIVKIENQNMEINFDGWSGKWNCWYRMKNYKVCAFKNNSGPYSGQNSVAIRPHQSFTSEKLANESAKLQNFIDSDLEGMDAFEITQYCRGHLTIFTDFLLGNNNYNAQDQADINQFFKLVMKVIVTYLNKLRKMEDIFQEAHVENELWLVCPHHALSIVFPEFTYLLAKFFGGCHRALRWAFLHDENQVKPEGGLEKIITKDHTDYDFVEDIVSVNDFEVEEAKKRIASGEIEFGWVLNNVQYFHEIGGFDALCDTIAWGFEKVEEEKAKDGEEQKAAPKTGSLLRIPLGLVSAFLKSMKSLKTILKPAFATQFVDRVKNVILKRLNTLDDKDVKALNKDEVSRVLRALKEFLLIGMTPPEAAKEIETAQLNLSLRFLKSNNLEKRLKGLNDIRVMVESVLSSARLANMKARKTGQQAPADNMWRGGIDEEDEDDQYGFINNQKKRAPPSQFMTTGTMREWLVANKFIEAVLGENAHTEIVKRSGPILKFLIKYGEGTFNASCVEIVWKCQMDKHEEMVRTVYNLIQEISPVLSLQLIDEFFKRIRQVPQNQYDEKFLNFLKYLTGRALESAYLAKRDELRAEHQDQDEEDMAHTNFQAGEDLENLFSKREMLTVKHLAENLQKLENTNEPQDESFLYGLPVFWNICCDQMMTNTSGISSMSSGESTITSEIQELATNAITELFGANFRRMVRMPFLLKALKNILDGKALLQSISIVKAIVKGYNSDCQMYGTASMVNDIDDDVNTNNQEDEEELKDLAFQMQKQLNIINFLVEDCHKYNEQVKQKLKVMAENNINIPENIDEYMFISKHQHGETLQNILDFTEFLVLEGTKVHIGIDNIEKLWQMFVREPNFEQDQSRFLKWVNKQRTKQDNTHRTYEQSLLSADEKEHLFTRILCDQEHMDPNKVNLAQAKCFMKYFKQINRSRRFLRESYGRLSIYNFKELAGRESLWNFAVATQNQKARDALSELTVDVYLKLSPDENHFTTEERNEISTDFIQRCMAELSDSSEKAVDRKKGVIQIISLYLDRFEGIRQIKPENPIAARFPAIRPLNIDVHRKMVGLPAQSEAVQVNFFQTIGFFRHKIAQTFGLQINQFQLIVKQQILDPDDDDRYMKELNPIQNAFLKTNPHYDPAQHPKLIIASNPQYFDAIFDLLNQNNPAILEPAWTLISRLPVNVTLEENLRELTAVKRAKAENTDLSAAWSSLLDKNSIYKLLYCLNIIKDKFFNAEIPSVQEEDKMSGVETTSKSWKLQFVELGGFNHLLDILINVQVNEIHSMLTLRCIQSITNMILELTLDVNINAVVPLLRDLTLNMQQQLLLRTLSFVKQVFVFSIEEEAKRGYSYQQLIRKITESKEKKKRQKMLMTAGKQQQKGADDDDDGGDSTEKQEVQKLIEEFAAQADLVTVMFSLISVLMKNTPDLTQVLTDYHNLPTMFAMGMIQTDNWNLRKKFCNKICQLVYDNSQAADVTEIRYALAQKILSTLLFDTTNKSALAQYESRCDHFYLCMNEILSFVKAKDLMPFKDITLQLIDTLTEQVRNRPITEGNSQDQDMLLQGHMIILTKLLQQVPAQKLPIGKKIINYLLHECLFETPKGASSVSKAAPKCKNGLTRHYCFELIAVLSRDCLENLEVVLEYLHNFNMKPSWRTNKDNDWKIKLYDDEKSSTGYVGIKNLGCICYMNSVNQQLFMIPGFRNDILQISDPNNDKNPDEDNMFLQWQTLFAGLLLSEKMYVNPKAYCHSFKDWEGQPVNVIEQMDVEEYLNMFLDKLENSIKGTDRAGTINYHFGGQLANEMIGKTCPHRFTRLEPMLSVGVTVKNKKSVKEGMEAFIQGDMLEADNQYHCEKCDKKVDALKRTCIKKLPRYMLMTLKRFEFDFDTMQRQKVNDYFEWPNDLDMSPYTQEYLASRERYEDAKKAIIDRQLDAGTEEELLEKLEQQALKHPKEYYEYEIVGTVVHTGTADSGHYYSYIKEQNNLEQQDQWYEFNDIWVRDFDPAEIPAECFGGEETGFSNMMWQNQQKMMKFRNSYILVYRRKLQDDVEFSDDEEEKNENKPDVQLGQKELNLSQGVEDNQIMKKIAFENHKYWQNKYLFGKEYTQFIAEIAVNWNTLNRLPATVYSRNDDWNIMDMIMRGNREVAYVPYQAGCEAPSDAQQDVLALYTPDRLNSNLHKVFKTLCQFYLTIQQRASDKGYLPQLNRHIKAYINGDIECAIWLLKEFTNWEILKEQILEPGMRIMVKFVQGIIYCAMLKVYEKEKDQLNFICDDMRDEKKTEELRHTVLGSFIFLLLNKLPFVKLQYSSHQTQYLQLIARFVSLGPQARRLALRVGTIERLLNMFHGKSSPHYDEWTAARDLPVIENEHPGMGLPTPLETEGKRSAFAMMREKTRVAKLTTSTPKYKYLIRALGLLGQAIQITKSEQVTETETQDKVINTPFQTEDSGIGLNSHERLLFLPTSSYIVKVFDQARKPHAYIPLIKAYLNYCYANINAAVQLFEVVEVGLNNNDYNNIRQFYSLFETLLTATETEWHKEKADFWLKSWMNEIVAKHVGYFLWMEFSIGWILRATSRSTFLRTWFEQNKGEWEGIVQWVRQNRDPPSAYSNYNQGGGSRMKLTKKSTYQYQANSMARQDKLKNAAMQKYTLTRLAELIDPPEVRPDRSNVPDIDILDFHDYKWTLGQEIEIMDSRFASDVQKATISQVLDEMINVKYTQTRVDEYNRQQNNPSWINTDPCKIYPAGFFENQEHIARVAQIEQDLKNQHRMQMQAQQQNRQMAGQDDDEDGSNRYQQRQGQGYANAPDSDDDNELYESSPNTQGAQDHDMSGENADSDNETN